MRSGSNGIKALLHAKRLSKRLAALGCRHTHWQRCRRLACTTKSALLVRQGKLHGTVTGTSIAPRTPAASPHLLESTKTSFPPPDRSSSSLVYLGGHSSGSDSRCMLGAKGGGRGQPPHHALKGTGCDQSGVSPVWGPTHEWAVLVELREVSVGHMLGHMLGTKGGGRGANHRNYVLKTGRMTSQACLPCRGQRTSGTTLHGLSTWQSRRSVWDMRRAACASA